MSQYSAQAAAELHCALTEQTYRTLLQSETDQLELHIAGDPAHPFFQQALFHPVPSAHTQAAVKTQHLPQVAGDLGDKMRSALNTSLSNYDSVLLVGSDCPVFTPEHLSQAFQALEGSADQPGADLVLIPAEDGGYVLIGSRTPLPEDIFTGIAWGQSCVLEQTLNNLTHKGLSYTLLPSLWDVDHPEDVVRWQQQENAGYPFSVLKTA